jgi:MSHA biogenesis protein MshI
MAWCWKAQRLPGWVSIGLTPEQIDVAHVRVNGAGRPQVLLCDSYKIEGTVAASLAQLRKSLKLDHARCTTLFGSADYQLLQLDAPNVPPAERRAAASFRVKDLIDYPLDRANIDVIEIPAPSGKVTSLFAFVAHDDKVSERVRIFDEAEVPLESIDVPELAQRNVAALFETEGRALAMVSFDAQGGLLTITCDGELLLSRSLDVTTVQFAGADEERRAQLRERIGLELQRSFDNYDRQNNSMALAKVLVTKLPGEVGLRDYLANNLSLPVEFPELDGVMDCSKVPELRNPLRQGECLKLLGAGLRGEMPVLKAA